MAADEPDQTAIVPIYTGKHLWSGKRPTEPMPPGTICAPEVAYEELPSPNGDRAKLPPCTVRWQFTGAFNLNRDEGIARGSFRVQVRHALAAKKMVNVDCAISFPRGTGRQKLVEITVAPDVLATLAEPYVRVHDVWATQISFLNDPTPPEDTNNMVALVSSAVSADGGIDPARVHAIPGYIKLGGADCELHYVGRLAWCTTCKADAGNFHLFELCPRRRCYNCREYGHAAHQCTAETAASNTDADMADQQAADNHRIAALHDPSSDLGKADIVLLQEMRLADPTSLPLLNPFLSLHHPVRTRAHQAVLGKDTGILLRNTRWEVEATEHHDHCTYARAQFWNDDVPHLSRLDASSMTPDSAGIVGADWNAIESDAFDHFPAGGQPSRVPHGLLNQAGLVDVFQTLHPTGTAFTRFHQVDNAIVSARRLDGVSVTHSLVPHLKSVSASEPAMLGLIWDLVPGDSIKMRTDSQVLHYVYLNSQANNRNTSVAHQWTLSSPLLNGCAPQRRTSQRRKARIGTSESSNARRFCGTSQHSISGMEINMYQPTSWIIPRLESRSFAATPDLVDDRGTHTELHAKLRAIHRFYTTLFTPRQRDTLSEEAAAILLGSVTRRISSATRHKLEAPFTASELRAALQRTPDMSAPGMDGLTFPLIRAAGDVFLERISRLGNALMRGHRLPIGEPMLRGVLLPKKGDLSLLRNYRPLSIATTAFRLLGGAVSNRLQAAASEVVHSAQTGFIAGRSSASNVITVALLQHAVKSGHIAEPLWILNLDQQKAYDRVRHEWLLDCLQAYGFGPRFLTYIKEIY
ncbi:hypothetical protein [Sporisorium scitamineum]|uniref:CCHC-type domain-containing protein n=1 Tax=Sporisorium scitamineum TaxID=49012 RepID=A0A0F7RRV0_9BASI|nr:hypothetical protein [Sporisorium scitamineum]